MSRLTKEEARLCLDGLATIFEEGGWSPTHFSSADFESESFIQELLETANLTHDEFKLWMVITSS